MERILLADDCCCVEDQQFDDLEQLDDNFHSFIIHKRPTIVRRRGDLCPHCDINRHNLRHHTKSFPVLIQKESKKMLQIQEKTEEARFWAPIEFQVEYGFLCIDVMKACYLFAPDEQGSDSKDIDSKSMAAIMKETAEKVARDSKLAIDGDEEAFRLFRLAVVASLEYSLLKTNCCVFGPAIDTSFFTNFLTPVHLAAIANRTEADAEIIQHLSSFGRTELGLGVGASVFARLMMCCGSIELRLNLAGVELKGISFNSGEGIVTIFSSVFTKTTDMRNDFHLYGFLNSLLLLDSLMLKINFEMGSKGIFRPRFTLFARFRTNYFNKKDGESNAFGITGGFMLGI